MVKPVGEVLGQESAIIINERSGQAAVRNFETLSDSILNPLVEHDIHLQNTLNLYSAINSQDGFLQKAGTAASYKSYNVAGARANRDTMVKHSELEFQRAFGLFAIEGFGRANMTVVSEWCEASHNRFRALYSHRRQAPARALLYESLRDRVTTAQSRTTIQNRELGLRPHKQQPAATISEELRTVERLEALRDDKRAGFLPTTNNEKNYTLAFLDYLDNPEYPLGINNHMIGIFNHQARLDKPNRYDVARQAMASIPYEIGDSLENALMSLQALRHLETEVADCDNPRVPLTEISEGLEQAFGPLIRYRDLAALRNRKSSGLPVKDILRSKFNRNQPQTLPNKNKTVEDKYTGSKCSDVMDQYIAVEISKLTVGKTRRLVSAAIADQELRQDFLERRLRELASGQDSRYLIASHTAQTILKHLQLAS